MIRIDRAVIIATVMVVLLSAVVPVSVTTTAPKAEEVTKSTEAFESINFYVYFNDWNPNNNLPEGRTPLKGSGSTLASVITSAFESSEDYKVELLPTGAVAAVNDVIPEKGKMWVIYQWLPPEGWTPVTPGPLADVTMVENTSYLIAVSEYRESSNKTVYEPPDVRGPVSEAVFYLQCSDEYDIKPQQLGEGEIGEDLLEKLHRGLYITGQGSSISEAFADACKKSFSWEGPTYESGALILKVPDSRSAGLTEDQKIGLEMGIGGESGTIPGWLGIFMGLKDVNVDNFYIYWNQYSWSDAEYKWNYNGFCLGYYDPGVIKYVGLVYTSGSAMDPGDHTPLDGIDPHDYVPE